MISKHFIIWIFLLVLIISCSEEPIFDNLFDPDTPLNNIQGNLGLTQLSDSQVILSWTKNNDVVGNYVIERKVGEGDFVVRDSMLAETTTYIDTALTVHTLYSYKIYGANDENVTNSISGSITTTFAQIDSFRAEQLDIFTAEITWSHECDYEEGYIIERKDLGEQKDVSKDNKIITRNKDDDFIILDTLAANTFSYIDNGLEPNNTYEYRIIAFSKYNESNYETDEFYNIIPAPTNLTLTQDNVHTFYLIWNDNSKGEQGFRIERKIDNGDYILIHTNTENDTTLTDDINAKNTYETVYYKIYAFYEEIYSESLESNCAIGFPAPSNLNCTPIYIDQIELEWTDNSIGEDGFIIEQKENGGNFIEIGNTFQSNYIASNLSFDSDYVFRVKAFSGSNNSNYCNGCSVNIQESITPTDLMATAYNDFVYLCWTDNCSFEEGFAIERKEQGGSFSQIGMVEENVIDFTDDQNLNYGTTYIYRVCAYNNSYFSSFSSEISITYSPVIYIKYYVKAGPEQPDPGENLEIYYYSVDDNWIHTRTIIPSQASNWTLFEDEISDQNAQHPGFKIKFIQSAHSSGSSYDHYYLDDVEILASSNIIFSDDFSNGISSSNWPTQTGVISQSSYYWSYPYSMKFNGSGIREAITREMP